MLYWAEWSCAATAGAEVGTFDKHWGEDKRLTWLAWTDVLDWERSAAGGGAEGTARKAGAVASTEESGAEAAKKTESPVSPCHSAPLRSKRGKRRRRVSVAIRQSNVLEPYRAGGGVRRKATTLEWRITVPTM